MSFLAVFQNGDLFIVGSVIAADAIGKLIRLSKTSAGQGDKWSHGKTITRIVCVCACVVLLLATSVEFSQVSSRIESKETYNAEVIARDSLVLFGWILAAGIGVILVMEED